MRKRILFITVTTINDGPGNQLGMLVTSLDLAKYEPIVLTIRSGGEWDATYKKLGIQRINLGLRIPFDLLAIIPLLVQIRKLRPDLVQTQMVRADIFGRLAARMLGVRHLSVIHNMDIWKRSGKPFDVLTSFIDRMQLRKAHAVVAVSNAVKRDTVHLQHVPPSKIRVIKNAIDVDRFTRPELKLEAEELRSRLAIPSDALVIAGTHRFTMQKAPDVWLAAITKVLRKYPSTHVISAGDGPLYEDIAAAADALGLSNLHLLGGIDAIKVPGLLAASDIFLLTSRFEGLPLAVLEAMAARSVPVATHVSGTPEAIANTEIGYLVPPNDPGLAAQAIEKLIKDAKLRKKMADNAYLHAIKYFHKDRMAGEYAALYQELLS